MSTTDRTLHLSGLHFVLCNEEDGAVPIWIPSDRETERRLHDED